MKGKKNSRLDAPAKTPQGSLLDRINRKKGVLPTTYELAMLAATMRASPDEAMQLWLDAEALRDLAWIVRSQEGDYYGLAEVMDGLNIKTPATFKKLLAATLQEKSETEISTKEVDRLWDEMLSRGVISAMAYSLEKTYHERNAERGRDNRLAVNGVNKRKSGKRRKPVK